MYKDRLKSIWEVLMGKISQLIFPVIGIPISPNVVPIGTPLCGILSDCLQRIFLSVLSVSNDPDKSGEWAVSK